MASSNSFFSLFFFSSSFIICIIFDSNLGNISLVCFHCSLNFFFSSSISSIRFTSNSFCFFSKSNISSSDTLFSLIFSRFFKISVLISFSCFSLYLFSKALNKYWLIFIGLSFAWSFMKLNLSLFSLFLSRIISNSLSLIFSNSFFFFSSSSSFICSYSFCFKS